MKRNLFVCMAAMGIAGGLALSAWAATDLADVDMTVTSLVGDEVFENTSETAATLTLDLADDVTWTGSVSGPVNLVKAGAGTNSVGNTHFRNKAFGRIVLEDDAAT